MYKSNASLPRYGIEECGVRNTEDRSNKMEHFREFSVPFCQHLITLTQALDRNFFLLHISMASSIIPTQGFFPKPKPLPTSAKYCRILRARSLPWSVDETGVCDNLAQLAIFKGIPKSASCDGGRCWEPVDDIVVSEDETEDVSSEFSNPR